MTKTRERHAPSDEDNLGNIGESVNTTELQEIANELIESMPDVNQHVIESDNRVAQEGDSQHALLDRHGDSFDPDKHLIDGDGKPVLNAAGKLRLKKGRPKKGDDSPSQSKRIESKIGVKPSPSFISQSQPVAPDVQARATGAAAANILITLSVQLGGDEFYPISRPDIGVDEKTLLEKSFGDYFQATGRTDFPPNVALMLVICGYLLPRFTMPKTRTRLERLKAWIVSVIAKRKSKKLARQVTSPAPEPAFYNSARNPENWNL